MNINIDINIKFIIIPDKSIGSLFSPFLTKSDSPVKELSSTFKSLLCIRTPSAGSKSPENNKC